MDVHRAVRLGSVALLHTGPEEAAAHQTVRARARNRDDGRRAVCATAPARRPRGLPSGRRSIGSTACRIPRFVAAKPQQRSEEQLRRDVADPPVHAACSLPETFGRRARLAFQHAQLTVEARSEARLALEAGARAPALAAARGRLVARRAADERDDGRRGPAPAGVPRRPRREAETERSAAWIRSQQRADGTWANFFEGPGDLSTTIEAYWALRLAGDDPGEEHMRIAAEFVRGQGGIAAARVFTHLWLALFGLWSWDRVPVAADRDRAAAGPLPSQRLRLRVLGTTDDRGAVGRQSPPSVPPAALRPRRARTAARPARAPASRRARSARARRRGWLAARPRAARSTNGARSRPLRRLALARAESWIVRRQEADGSWGGIQPPWVYSLIALDLVRVPDRSPGDAARPRRDRERSWSRTATTRTASARRRAASRRLEACQSPIWDTALAMIALSDAGLRGEHPALRPRRALAARRGGDACAATGPSSGPRLAPGGWAFEFANVNYPDVDDTAEVVLALERLGGSLPLDRARRAPARAPSTGSAACRAPTAAGAPSTPTTHARWCASCRSWTSAR